MRLATSFVGASALVALGFLSNRTFEVERRVAMLEQTTKAQTIASSATSYSAAVSASDGDVGGIESHLQSFHERIEALEHAPHASRVVSGADEERLHAEQEILSVIERESRRVHDAQLDWHKAHWLDARNQQLSAFAASQKLKPAQTNSLNAVIEKELNALVEVMRRPSFAEEPDEVADDWLRILSDTDRRAQEILDPEQYQTWQKDRLLGRKLLWPWLPDKPKDNVER